MYSHDNRTLRLEETPAYKSIERVIWIVGTAIVLFLLLSMPSMWLARQQTDAAYATAVAAENSTYCRKWGMREGSAALAICIRDLVDIRARTEEHLRDQFADGI